MLIGASCSGKSTLAKALYNVLCLKNQNWVIIDLDEIGEGDLNALTRVVNEKLHDGHNIIIDTNTYEPGIEKSYQITGADLLLKILVYAEKELLLSRDALRTQRLVRTEERAYWARRFVEETASMGEIFSPDLVIDTGKNDIDLSVLMLLDFYNANFHKK